MNIDKETWIKINNTMRKLEIDRDSRQINAIKIHPAESWLHFTEKCKICWELYMNKGHPFLTEAFAKNRSMKFDIVDLVEETDDNVIEIVITSNPPRDIRTKVVIVNPDKHPKDYDF